MRGAGQGCRDRRPLGTLHDDLAALDGGRTKPPGITPASSPLRETNVFPHQK